MSEQSEESKTSKRRRPESEWSDSSDDELLVEIARRYKIHNQPIQNDGEIASSSSASVPPAKKPRKTPTQFDDDILSNIPLHRINARSGNIGR
jgi:hypothetical protein